HPDVTRWSHYEVTGTATVAGVRVPVASDHALVLGWRTGSARVPAGQVGADPTEDDDFGSAAAEQVSYAAGDLLAEVQAVVFHWAPVPPDGPASQYAHARELLARLAGAVDTARAELDTAARSARVMAAHRQAQAGQTGGAQ